MNPPVLNEAGALPEGLPTFPTLIRLFPSVHSPVVTEAVAFAKRFPAFTAHETSFPAEVSLVTPKRVSASVVLGVLSSGVCGPILEESGACHQVPHNLATRKGLPRHTERVVLPRRGSDPGRPEAFLSNALLLVRKVCVEIHLFVTDPRLVEFLSTRCSMVLGRMEKFSQVWATHLPRMSLLGGHSRLGSPAP